MSTFRAKVISLLKSNTGDTNDFQLLNTTAYTADQLGETNSLAIVNTTITGRPHDNHGVYISIAGVNTPFQLMLADTSNRYIWKRYKSSGTWSDWFKLSAGQADQLTTARTINGTSFNGTANITTANWGTARTLTIGNKG